MTTPNDSKPNQRHETTHSFTLQTYTSPHEALNSYANALAEIFKATRFDDPSHSCEMLVRLWLGVGSVGQCLDAVSYLLSRPSQTLTSSTLAYLQQWKESMVSLDPLQNLYRCDRQHVHASEYICYIFSEPLCTPQHKYTPSRHTRRLPSRVASSRDQLRAISQKFHQVQSRRLCLCT